MKLDLYSLFSAKYAQWINIALMTLFSLLILVECSGLNFWEKIEPIPVRKELKKIAKQNEYNAVFHSSLFGTYIPNHINEPNVKKSILNVTLVGILFANKLNNSQVIIRSANGEERIYKLDDTIHGDAVIKRIMVNGILVDRQGVLESLSLPKNKLSFEPVASPLKGE